MKAFACVGTGLAPCGVDTSTAGEYYMVNEHVWLKSGMQPKGGMLCIGCLEGRLGRKLTHEDFTDCPLNSGGFCGQSDRLRDRLKRKVTHEAR